MLLLGYEMYRLLIKTRGVPIKSRRASKKTNSEPVVIDIEEEEVNKEIIKSKFSSTLEAFFNLKRDSEII